MRAYIAAAAVLGSLAAVGSGAMAQGGGWCENNMCDYMGGDCQLTTHAYNCNETVQPTGCQDEACRES